MRAVATVVLVLASMVLAAAASARDPKDPQQRHTAADTKLAGSIALKLPDLASGWKAAPKDKPAPPCSTEPDESKLVQTARIDPTFVWQDGITTVGSEIDIFRTTAQAERDWRLSTLKVMRDCLLESARKDLSAQHVTVHVLSATALPPPKRGERSLHYRLVFQLKGKRTVRAVSEMIAIGTGRISVVLHGFSLVRPLPAAALDSLTALLAKRLVAASGAI